MKNDKRNSIIFLTSLLLVISTKAFSPVNIIKLSDRNIRIAIKKYHRVLIFFHNKWCEESKAALSNITSLTRSEESKKIRDMRVIFTQFNSREEKEILNELNVQQYPSLKFFIEGAEIPYNREDFSGENIMRFLLENVSRDIKYFEGVDDIFSKTDEKNFRVIFYGHEKSHRFPLFKSASYTFKDVSFGVMQPKRKNSKEEEKKLKMFKEDNINIISPNGEITHYRKAWTQSRVNNWIFENLNPGVVPLDQEFYHLIIEKKNPAFLFIVKIFIFKFLEL